MRIGDPGDAIDRAFRRQRSRFKHETATGELVSNPRLGQFRRQVFEFLDRSRIMCGEHQITRVRSAGDSGPSQGVENLGPQRLRPFGVVL